MQGIKLHRPNYRGKYKKTQSYLILSGSEILMNRDNSMTNWRRLIAIINNRGSLLIQVELNQVSLFSITLNYSYTLIKQEN